MDQDPTLKEKILQTVALIPKGKVCTYGKVAEYAGAERRARFVGTVLKQLPAGTKIPWHRVINSQGKSSFPEDSDHYQEQMNRLQQEEVVAMKGKINLQRYLWMP
ncbi:MAG: MGMT family protein [Pseudomonadales bacterium]|nr:MGMT family protein [Pseudomonadales bacterium]